MFKKIKALFGKDVDKDIAPLPKSENIRFLLTIDDIAVGYLYANNGEWQFEYSKEFRKHPDYHRIVGFPELDQRYTSEELWPFFQIRIPGLKQPAVQEILEKENIDQNDEIALLKRFGKKTIANPYQLVVA